MLFNSLQFLIFFPIVLLFYYVIPKKVRYIWLLISSYYFYMCWNAKYALLLLFSTAITYVCGVLMENVKQKDWKETKIVFYKKFYLIISFILNLSVLFFFKYFNFAFSTLNHAFSLIHIHLNQPTFDVLLPVGISFYTFQALGYTMDVYRNDIYAEKNFFRYALFVSFFPQLVAGPIERSKNLLKQLAKPSAANFDAIREGLFLMLWGFFLKIVLADRIAIFVDTVYNNYNTYGGMYLIIATLLFAVQIYCDFSGYSIIAMGTAKMLGINLMENFNAPYFSKSASEFWRRWHISLSSWFRDYLYIPLGGNRKGKIRKYINIIITFSVSGLWHGANWTYVIWGLLNGIYQVLGQILAPVRKILIHLLDLKENSLSHNALRIIWTNILICFSWIFFRAPGLHASVEILDSIVNMDNLYILFNDALYKCGLDQKNFHLMLLGICILCFADFCKYRGIKIRAILAKQDWWFQCLLISFSVCLLLLFGIWGTQYNEASFI